MCKIKEFAIVYIAFILVFILINISLYQINISCKSLLEFNMNNERIAEHKKENLLTFSQEAQISDITEIYEWKIIIPKIELEANIKEGTSQEVMSKSVGHFEESSLLKGNVALAAHNRGYKMNFFENIKDLSIGDELIYIVNNVENRYKIVIKEVIDDRNWKYISNTLDNRLTLITCVENKPENRLCIQGVQI